ncbi:uncharacterized protein JCM15063_006044 [Sporobolomyces koalae]|uniref:uncharacterized protein n=1 Tax=Sporobolomyces koalae TaxID=500713 RepID=UPI00317E10FA
MWERPSQFAREDIRVDPFRSFVPRELRESEDSWDDQIAAEAEALHARADQILAKDEADYVIPLVFSTSADAPTRLAAATERSLDRSAPSTLSIPVDDVPESSERDTHARPARVIYSEDSDTLRTS